MSTLAKKNLLTFGFVRKCCNGKIIESIPEDIIQLFVVWLSLSDHFAEDKCHPNIKIETVSNKYQIAYRSSVDGGSYVSAIGNDVVSQKEKQEWRLQFIELTTEFPTVLIGIIGNEIVNSIEYIDDFTDYNMGYGLYPECQVTYNGPASETSFMYSSQFKLEQGLIITMTLDMSQENNNYGTLSYEYDESKKYKEILDPDITHIAFDNVNKNQSYRLAIAFHFTISSDVKIALLQ